MAVVTPGSVGGSPTLRSNIAAGAPPPSSAPMGRAVMCFDSQSHQSKPVKGVPLRQLIGVCIPPSYGAHLPEKRYVQMASSTICGYSLPIDDGPDSLSRTDSMSVGRGGDPAALKKTKKEKGHAANRERI